MLLGIFGSLVSDKNPGSIPLLVNIASPYKGEVMDPFETVP